MGMAINIMRRERRSNAKGIPSPGALEFIVDLTVRSLISKREFIYEVELMKSRSISLK